MCFRDSGLQEKPMKNKNILHLADQTIISTSHLNTLNLKLTQLLITQIYDSDNSFKVVRNDNHIVWKKYVDVINNPHKQFDQHFKDFKMFETQFKHFAFSTFAVEVGVQSIFLVNEDLTNQLYGQGSLMNICKQFCDRILHNASGPVLTFWSLQSTINEV
ncbi:hypothetical protein E2320_009736, partial [Naja naja]